jgi:hypothetical protein
MFLKRFYWFAKVFTVVFGVGLMPSVGAQDISINDLLEIARKGNAKAQYSLGDIYDRGEGVAKDYKEAVRWFQLSAAQGYAPAQHNLGVMYAMGQYVPQDDIQAYMWLSLAALGLTDQDYEVFVATREAVAKEMTSEQIERAEQLSREWKPKQ